MAEDIEKISALRLGADDYIVKPFNPLEVVERVKAILRRLDGAAAPERTLSIGVLDIDRSAHAVFIREGRDRRLVFLTHTEFLLIAHMASAPRRAFSRSELVDACLPEGEVLARTIDSHVSNARRYAGSGKYVRVETRREGEQAWLHVIDHGPGIEEADRDRIFDRWWRAETSRARAQGGSGLGLAIVRAIARAHGGEATAAANTKGAGVTFSIRLPVHAK